jgi:5-methyltetrahydropteroyltriglutamate--homocysteine methyltransferase
VDELTNFVLDDVKHATAGGAAYVQVDHPGYRVFMDRSAYEQIAAAGRDPVRELATEVAGTNKCLRLAKRGGATTAVHICFGTYIGGNQSPVDQRIKFDPELVGELLAALDADRFLVEFGPRVLEQSEMESLKYAPKDKTIVLGIPNVRDPRLESADDILRKIEAASKYVPLKNLALSANCGFAGSAAGTWMDESMQWRKLELIVAVAAQVWGTS